MIFNPKKEIGIFLAIFLVSCFLVYLFLNGGAYFRILRYELLLRFPFIEKDLGVKPILDFGNAPETRTTGNEKSYNLYIPKISVLAPIIFPKDKSNENILTSLEDGVALYPGSSMPGENGRAVILGHSSRITWYRGRYAYVFALLNKLQSGDEFYVVSGNKRLVYKVFANDTLTPEKTNEILSQPPKNKSEIALITCWPIGSSSKRTLIQAKLDNMEQL